MSNPNVPFFVKVTVDLLVGYEINKDGADKVQANATLAVSIAQTVVDAGGDPAAALVAIEQQLTASVTDPAKLAAIQTVILFIGNKAASLQGLIDGSVTAALIASQLVAAANEALLVAKKYLPAS